MLVLIRSVRVTIGGSRRSIANNLESELTAAGGVRLWSTQLYLSLPPARLSLEVTSDPSLTESSLQKNTVINWSTSSSIGPNHFLNSTEVGAVSQNVDVAD